MNTTFLPGFPRLPLVVGPERAADGRLPALLDWLVEEVSISINTSAAGGNASLMTIA